MGLVAARVGCLLLLVARCAVPLFACGVKGGATRLRPAVLLLRSRLFYAAFFVCAELTLVTVAPIFGSLPLRPISSLAPCLLL